MGSAREFIEFKLKENKIVVFSKSSCPFCTMAKEALKGYEYECIEIEKLPNCSEIQDELQKMTGARTVPRVFVGEECIGGGTETRDLAKNGQLAKKVNKL